MTPNHPMGWITQYKVNTDLKKTRIPQRLSRRTWVSKAMMTLMQGVRFNGLFSCLVEKIYKRFGKIMLLHLKQHQSKMRIKKLRRMVGFVVGFSARALYSCDNYRSRCCCNRRLKHSSSLSTLTKRITPTTFWNANSNEHWTRGATLQFQMIKGKFQFRMPKLKFVDFCVHKWPRISLLPLLAMYFFSNNHIFVAFGVRCESPVGKILSVCCV